MKITTAQSTTGLLVGLLASLSVPAIFASSPQQKTKLSVAPQSAHLKLNFASSTYLNGWGIKSIGANQKAVSPNEEIIVAVIDTGADLTHPALKNKLWVNKGEVGTVDSVACATHARELVMCNKSINQIDDDGNGYIDDVHGFNFAGNDNDLTDRHGHGTHIAGIINAVNEKNPNVKIMVLKYYDPRLGNELAIEKTVRAMDYAIQMGAKIINYSAGGPIANSFERAAVERAHSNNVILVAAAGNEASNSDRTPYYPADYNVDNVMSVTAYDPKLSILNSSNFGRESVKVAAPGEDILSTAPGGGYALMTGTSQATAFASGAVASYLSQTGSVETPREVIEHFVESGIERESFLGKTMNATQLNLPRALAIRDNTTDVNGVATDDRSEETLIRLASGEGVSDRLEQMPEQMPEPTHQILRAPSSSP